MSGAPAHGVDAEASATLQATRARVEGLAVDDGSYTVACRESGVSPAPVSGTTFETYRDAERARDAALAYRGALAALDPDVARYDLTVSEATDTSVEVASVRERSGRTRANGLPASEQSVTVAGGGSDEWLRVENGPVVHLRGTGETLDDEVVARQLEVKL